MIEMMSNMILKRRQRSTRNVLTCLDLEMTMKTISLTTKRKKSVDIEKNSEMMKKIRKRMKNQ
jgi:hypothetical protein